MNPLERLWLALSNAVSEFIINRVESGHAAAAGEDLATYRTRVYGDSGGVVSLIEQGKPGAVSRVPAVHRRAPVAGPAQRLGEEAFQRCIAEEAERPARVLVGPDTLEKEGMYPAISRGWNWY